MCAGVKNDLGKPLVKGCFLQQGAVALSVWNSRHSRWAAVKLELVDARGVAEVHFGFSLSLVPHMRGIGDLPPAFR